MPRSVLPLRALRALRSGKTVARLTIRNQYQTLHETHSPRTATTTATQADPKTITSPILKTSERPLSLLPFGLLVRSYVFAALSSNPIFLNPSLRLLSIFAHSKSALLNPDRNPLLRYILKRTFYSHFCAGETSKEIQKTTEGLKRIGYHGVILTYGKETVLETGDEASSEGNVEDLAAKREVDSWKIGILETLRLAGRGDMVALR